MTWSTYKPTDSTPWNVQRVVHLHRRAGFGATWSEVQRDLESGPDAAIERLLGATRLDETSDFEKMAANIGDAATASNNSARLRAWWFYRMLMSPDALGERLTLMWHNHFATSNRKVENLVWMRQQNDILRTHARSNFGELLSAVLKHPAMLKWLDAEANRKGHPNENLARELFELFALGIGNYAEDDVLAAAQALTGWSIKDGKFLFRESRHDNSEIQLFGKTERLDGDGLIQRSLAHPATAKRLAWRICKTFMGTDACDETAVNELADGLAKNNLNIGWAVTTVLRSERFFADSNLRQRITGPAEHIVASINVLEFCDRPPSTMQLGEWSARMGQDLFHPPNVGGWNEGRAWLGSRAIIARANFGTAVATGTLWNRQDADRVESALERLCKRHQVDDGIDARTEWFSTLLMGTTNDAVTKAIVNEVQSQKTEQQERPLADIVRLLMARPEYQLS